MALHWQILIGMILGAALGLTLNATCGTSRNTFTTAALESNVAADQKMRKAFPEGVSKIVIDDSPDRTQIDLFFDANPETNEPATTQTLIIDPTRKTRGSFENESRLAAEYPRVAAFYHAYGTRAAKHWGSWFKRIGDLFLRMLKMVAIPLIVTSLLTGIMGVGAAGKLGGLFRRTMLYYLITSMLAIVTGLVAVNLLRPGLDGPSSGDSQAKMEDVKSLGDVIFEQIQA
ncbi:MAG: cation:dicarboxylase symporter family transporter, partial [Planctomycetota bacterium]